MKKKAEDAVVIGVGLAGVAGYFGFHEWSKRHPHPSPSPSPSPSPAPSPAPEPAPAPSPTPTPTPAPSPAPVPAPPPASSITRVSLSKAGRGLTMLGARGTAVAWFYADEAQAHADALALEAALAVEPTGMDPTSLRLRRNQAMNWFANAHLGLPRDLGSRMNPVQAGGHATRITPGGRVYTGDVVAHTVPKVMDRPDRVDYGSTPPAPPQDFMGPVQSGEDTRSGDGAGGWFGTGWERVPLTGFPGIPAPGSAKVGDSFGHGALDTATIVAQETWNGFVHTAAGFLGVPLGEARYLNEAVHGPKGYSDFLRGTTAKVDEGKNLVDIDKLHKPGWWPW